MDGLALPFGGWHARRRTPGCHPEPFAHAPVILSAAKDLLGLLERAPSQLRTGSAKDLLFLLPSAGADSSALRARRRHSGAPLSLERRSFGGGAGASATSE